MENKKILDKLDKNLTSGYDNFIKPGWMEVYMENLPSKGKFYPLNTKISINSGDGKDVTAWSMVDENDLVSVQESMNTILSRHLEITAGNKFLSWKDICDEDRFVLLLMIRDITFPETENQIGINTKCKCDNGSIILKHNHLTLNHLPDKYEKYYNYDRRLYEIKTKSFGTIELRPPSIGCSLASLEYIKRCREKRVKINEALFSIIPFMSLDWKNMDEKFVKDLEVDMLSWDAKKTSFMLRTIDEFKIGPNLMIKGDCKNCGSPLEGPLNFRGGIRTLFNIQDFDSELL